MPDRIARLTEMGFGEHDIRYLKHRGHGKDRIEALRGPRSDPGLQMNHRKAIRWFDRFCARTKWTESLHIQIGSWLIGGVCPIPFEAMDPITCPSCEEEQPATAFMFYPLELRCDQCVAKEMRLWLEHDKEIRSKRSSAGAQLAAALSQSEDGSAPPRAIDVMALIVECRGGLVCLTEEVADVLSSAATKDKLAFFKTYMEMLKAHEQPISTGIDAESLKNKPHLMRLVVDGLLKEWHREHERPALRDLIKRYGGTPPDEDDEDDDE